MRKKIFALAATAAMTMAMSLTAFAGVSVDGTRGNWILDDTGWWWQNEDGTWASSGWYWLDGNEDGVAECYLFDGNGYMMAGVTSADGFHLNADGAWVDDNGVVQTRSTTEQQAAQTDQTTYSDTAVNYDNGGYNEYGCSNVAIEMFNNTREQNEKFGEVDVAEYAIMTSVKYANGFSVNYPLDGGGTYKIVYVDSTRTDLDGTYLFKYYDPTLTSEEAASKLHSEGFAEGVGGAYANGNTCWAEVGNSAAINWYSKGNIVLR